jgi:hypothetical protein
MVRYRGRPRTQELLVPDYYQRLAESKDINFNNKRSFKKIIKWLKIKNEETIENFLGNKIIKDVTT